MDSDHESAALPAGATASAASGSPKRQKQKRSRAGCFQCKIKRRKCDLTKPQCQRCVAGSVECTYPTGVTFAPNKTFSHAECVQSPPAIPPSYSRLQFLEPGSRRRARSKPQELHSPKSSLPHTESPVAAQHETPGAEVSTPCPFQPPSDIPCADVSSPTTAHSHGLGIFDAVPEADEVLVSSYVTSPNTTDYETALEVLVSLGGASDTGPQEVQRMKYNFEGHHSKSSQPLQPVASAPGLDALRQRLDDMKILRLLTYYRYHVAPWLDMCDQGQTFGLVVPRLALQSNLVCCSLVSLTLSLSAKMGVAEMTVDDIPLPQSNSSLLDEFVADTLDKAHQFAAGLPLDWPKVTFHEATCVTRALTEGHVWRQAGSLRLRLLLSAALVSGGSAFPAQDLQQNTPTAVDSISNQNICDPTLEVLMLCARSLNICSGTASHTYADEPPAQSWGKQTQALQAWYDARREAFRPLLDVDMPPSDPTVALFPTIVFSTPAATLANSVYHAAMLLLLRRKPRTVPALSSGSSPLWHARRICAIALSNGSNAHWDPCLLSTLFVAARVMTYVLQQARIVRCFEEAGMRTGWRAMAQWFVDELHKIWTPT
ncbi:hypothetical protein PpBr36_04038 [Pyricularia pennisetigena]|uniref:hypothetical protein n=1 Tax=Pyricularia pennisetigena TaxID=1578925 RepID=UPI00114DFA44|nr:hypothetical protein PpBr36_04038 [Pyricularia pennisetigena]TLS26455.1 hypothetical protein PpBr36_04038 [Pyricularia pennisetigena]